MIIQKTFKYRLEPNRKQREQFAQFAGCCRFVWNKALAYQKDRLDRKEKVLNYAELCKLLTTWKKIEDTLFLGDTQSQTIQQTLKALTRAIKDAFSKKSDKRFPRFKKKGKADSFRYPQGIKINGNKIFLPKIGWVSFRKSRDIIGTVRNATVSRRGQNWFVSVQTEYEIDEPVHSSTSMVGVDMGVTRFATLSDGKVLEPLNSFKRLENKLAKEQRKLARKRKGSENWKKQKRAISKLHIKIADARADYLHKSSTEISKNHAMIVLEDLRISNMSASAKGNIENPGKNVKAKSGLNKSILDQGWFEFRRMLEYKQHWNGGQVLGVDPKNTSRKCSKCGHTHKDNRKTQSNFECMSCGYTENADLNAAKNILAAGHAVLACGDIKQVAA